VLFTQGIFFLVCHRNKIIRLLKKKPDSCMWWYMPVTPAFGRLRQEDREFQANIVYIAKPCLKKKKRSLVG
jgi:hypothetical protein